MYNTVARGLPRPYLLTTVIIAIVTTSGHATSPAPHDVLEGAVRTYYASGHLHQLKHYKHGREDGLQQAWTEDGTLYLNYEMRNGRRYGLVNARPCAPATDAGAQ